MSVKKPAPVQKLNRQQRTRNRIVTKVLALIEEANGKFETGAERKAYVTEQLNAWIDIPILGEHTEAIIFGLMVEIAVDRYNDLVHGRSVKPHTLAAEIAGDFVEALKSEKTREARSEIRGLLIDQGLPAVLAPIAVNLIFDLFSAAAKLWQKAAEKNAERAGE